MGTCPAANRAAIVMSLQHTASCEALLEKRQIQARVNLYIIYTEIGTNCPNRFECLYAANKSCYLEQLHSPRRCRCEISNPRDPSRSTLRHEVIWDAKTSETLWGEKPDRKLYCVARILQIASQTPLRGTLLF